MGMSGVEAIGYEAKSVGRDVTPDFSPVSNRVQLSQKDGGD